VCVCEPFILAEVLLVLEKVPASPKWCLWSLLAAENEIFPGVCAQQWFSQALLGVGAGCALGRGFPPSKAMTTEDWVGEVFHQLVLLLLSHASFISAWHEDWHFRKDPIQLPSRTWSCLEKAAHITVGLHTCSCQVGTHRLFPAPTASPAFIPGEEGPESPLPWLGALARLSPHLSYAGLHSHWLLENWGSYSPSDGFSEMGWGCRKV